MLVEKITSRDAISTPTVLFFLEKFEFIYVYLENFLNPY